MRRDDHDRRRVLMVAPQAFFRATGTPINVHLMCRALITGGFEVHLLTLPYGEDVTLPGLVVHRVPRLPGLREMPVGFSAAKLLYNPLLAQAMVRLMRRHDFAAVHAIEEAAFYAVPLARRFGIPGIADLDSDLCRQLREHGGATARALARPAAWLRRRALRQAAGSLTITRHLTALARAESPTTPVFQISDVPIDGAGRPPDPARMAAYRSELGLEGRRLLVYTGNYDRRQGLLELIRALPPVLRRHPDVALLAVGGDPQRIRELQAEADRQGIAASVRLAGPRPPETMADVMGMAELLVSPRLEPYATPLKIFSYMASGRPIVATDLPTHTEVLDAETAFLVPPTVAGLSGGLLAALDDPAAQERGAAARRRALARHTFAIFKDQLLEAYTAILGQGGAPVPAPAEGSTLAHG